jgi:hypothetical protein
VKDLQIASIIKIKKKKKKRGRYLSFAAVNKSK